MMKAWYSLAAEHRTACYRLIAPRCAIPSSQANFQKLIITLLLTLQPNDYYH